MQGNSLTPKIAALGVFLALLVMGNLNPEAAAAEKLNYRLKWLLNASTVGDIYADVHGFFAAEELDVAVKAGGPERDAIKELELGHAQFGVASADQVIRALDKGSPVVVLAQLFQINPLHWIYRAAKPPINTLADLKGRSVGITYGGNDETIMRTMLAKAGIKASEVTLVSVRYDYTPFYKDQVEVWPCYVNSQGVMLEDKLKAAGEAVNFINPADFGIRFVANSIVTSQQMVDEHPETVAKFTRALLAGWEAAFDDANRQKALEALAQFDKDTPPELMSRQFDTTRRLIVPPAGIPLGTIDREAWQQTETIMLENQQITARVEVTRVLQPMVQN
ncbi:MAG: ABC transporter substrate-binding protein [Desulfobacterales bacterium]